MQFEKDYGEFEKDYGEFEKDYGEFEKDYGEFQQEYGEFRRDAHAVSPGWHPGEKSLRKKATPGSCLTSFLNLRRKIHTAKRARTI